jgi:RNA polymerase sigma factor (sigma-70 family)
LRQTACHDAHVHDTEIAKIVAAAADGDERAWSELVRRYAGLVWAAARQVRLPAQDVEEASQLTWLQLSLHIRGLRDPGAVGGWLATTARREALQLARRRWDQPLTDEHLQAADRATGGPDEELLRAELREQVRAALDTLGERCQRLLRMLAQEPPSSYREISAELLIPMGSIGPVRARCLQRLRSAIELAGY